MVREKKRSTAFYVEALLLFCMFAAVILFLSRCFAGAERSRKAAAELSDAVYLARSAAEAACSCGDPEELLELLSSSPAGPGDEVLSMRREGSDQGEQDFGEIVLGGSDPVRGPGPCLLRIVWDRPQPDALISYTINVEDRETGETIYTLETAVYPRRPAV